MSPSLAVAAASHAESLTAGADCKNVKPSHDDLQGRNPMMSLRAEGWWLARLAERQYMAYSIQLPPRMTRPPEPDLYTGFFLVASSLE